MTECRNGDAGKWSQLGKAEMQSEKWAAVAISGHGLICSRA